MEIKQNFKWCKNFEVEKLAFHNRIDATNSDRNRFLKIDLDAVVTASSTVDKASTPNEFIITPQMAA